MTRFWVQWFANSVAVTRSLAALFSLLALPCIYWLCLELFNSSLVGWVAVALLAVTPFHVLYAQEAREYSLWTLTILLSSATLLRAMRLKTKLSWGMYAVTVALGLYTFVFSGLVSIAHGVYVIATENFRLTKRVIAYLLASLVEILAFTPWVVVILSQSTQINKTTGWTIGLIQKRGFCWSTSQMCPKFLILSVMCFSTILITMLLYRYCNISLRKSRNTR